jgi:hypothetical protein
MRVGEAVLLGWRGELRLVCVSCFTFLISDSANTNSKRKHGVLGNLTGLLMRGYDGKTAITNCNKMNTSGTRFTAHGKSRLFLPALVLA